MRRCSASSSWISCTRSPSCSATSVYLRKRPAGAPRSEISDAALAAAAARTHARAAEAVWRATLGMTWRRGARSSRASAQAAATQRLARCPPSPPPAALARATCRPRGRGRRSGTAAGSSGTCRARGSPARNPNRAHARTHARTQTHSCAHARRRMSRSCGRPRERAVGWHVLNQPICVKW